LADGASQTANGGHVFLRFAWQSQHEVELDLLDAQAAGQSGSLLQVLIPDWLGDSPT
jgi:hypothetical protein